MQKITYITLVNKAYEPYLEQLIKSHQMFSRINLIVYTVNFDVKNVNYRNISFIKYDDKNLTEFELTGKNKYIKDEFEKYYNLFISSKPNMNKNNNDHYACSHAFEEYQTCTKK